MPIDPATANLEACLCDFRDRFNDNAHVKMLIIGWNREILVEPLDAPSAYTMTIEDLKMISVTPGITEREDTVLVQADEEMLKRIFTGYHSPATAMMDGEMALFSAERDKEKLRVIAGVIWDF
jgi:hypothetical protein